MHTSWILYAIIICLETGEHSVINYKQFDLTHIAGRISRSRTSRLESRFVHVRDQPDFFVSQMNSALS